MPSSAAIEPGVTRDTFRRLVVRPFGDAVSGHPAALSLADVIRLCTDETASFTGDAPEACVTTRHGT